MQMSNSDIVKILMSNDHLSQEDKKVLLKILGYSNEDTQEKIPLGDRISDALTDFIGSWFFIILSTLTIVVWSILNVFILSNGGFDPFPFDSLNLILACVASIQSPIIMMSQNRQEKRESLKTQSDYEIDLKTIIIIQDLHSKLVDLCLKVDDLKLEIEKEKKGGNSNFKVVKSKSEK